MEPLAADDLFHRAFHNAAIGMALISPEGRWLKVNPAVCQIVGYTEAELLARTFQEITHPEDLDLDLAYLEQLSRGEIQAYRMEKRYYHRDAHIIWIHLSVTAVRHPDGLPRFYISQIEDITARKTLEAQLRDSVAERDRLIRELEASIKQNQQLRDQLVTICAWTNQIFHDGHWMSPDAFLARYLGLNLTHGISEEGRAMFMAERKTDEEPPTPSI